MDKYKELAIAASDCDFGVDCHSGYFSVNEQIVDGIPVQTVFCVNKDNYDGKDVFAIYSIPEIVDGDNIGEADWEYTESLSVEELADKIRRLATAFSAEDYHAMLVERRFVA